MDNSPGSLARQARKVVRYFRLYGPRRTWAKVRSRRHLKRRFDVWPRCSPPDGSQPLGIIGCGNHAFSTIAYFLRQRFGHVIGGCADVDLHRAASLSRHYRVPFYTDDPLELIDDERLSLIVIASNHASHAEYAIRALERGKDVYIEKPHVVDEDQLARLAGALQRTLGRVYLGFNRPASRLGRIARTALDGVSGAGTYNWFVAGHRLSAEHWYLHPREGGRVLGNLCHWTDFLLVLAGERAFPLRIRPAAHGHAAGHLAMSYHFGDGSLGTITFSEKEEPFEGVRERFSAHRGDVLLALDDFQTLTVERGPSKRRYRNLFRDHGHRTCITAAYENSTKRLPYDRSSEHARILNTAWLFLKTKQAIEEDRELVIGPYDAHSESHQPLKQAA